MSNQDSDIKPNLILEDEKALLLDHSYDGIEELNNPLPKWWQIIFYGSIIFAVVYVGYYQFGGGPTMKDELERDLAVIRGMQHENKSGDPIAEMTAMLNDPASVAKGKSVYMANCVPCHGDAGQGVVGPNLTDKFWIHGDGSLASSYKVVSEGVADKGMPPWGPVLSGEQLEEVVVYTATLKGSNPPNPKAPQGNEVK